MKPPICEVCHQRIMDEHLKDDVGGLVWFKDYKDLPADRVGHPRGLGWFCAQHFHQAKSLSDYNMADAVATIKSSF